MNKLCLHDDELDDLLADVKTLLTEVKGLLTEWLHDDGLTEEEDMDEDESLKQLAETERPPKRTRLGLVWESGKEH